MRRRRILESLDKIESSLESCGLSEFLESLANARSKSGGLSKALDVFEAITVAKHDWNSDVLEVSAIFDLSGILDRSTWQVLMSGTSTEKVTRAGEILDYWHKFKSVKPIVEQLISIDAAVERDDGVVLLSVYLIDDNNRASLAQVSNLMAGITLIGEVYREFTGEDMREIVLNSCDSGSDKEFIFAIPKDAYLFIKNFLVSIWHRLVFYRELEAEKRIEVVSKSLPVLAEIHSRREELGLETAAKLEKMVVEATTRIINSGSTISGLENTQDRSDRLLIQQKVLQITDKSSEE